MRAFLFFALCCLCTSAAYAQSDSLPAPFKPCGYDEMPIDSSITRTQHVLHIGEDSMLLVLYTHSRNGLTFFNMHDDENICVSEGLRLLSQTGGRLMELKHFGNLCDTARNMSFSLRGKTYTFDPNRIFSASDSVRALTLLNKRGLYQSVGTLKDLPSSRTPTSAECAAVARGELRQFADTLIHFLDTSQTRFIVALHNNHGYPARCDCGSRSRPARVIPESYSLSTYMRHGTLENASASDIYVNPRRHLTGFVIVLERADFMQLVEQQCNAVLQPITSPDDGSLSVWAAHKGFRYANIEAKFDRLEEQRWLVEQMQALLLRRPALAR